MSLLKEQFGDDFIYQYSLQEKPQMLLALSGFVAYLVQTQQSAVARLTTLELGQDERLMALDITARRNLELTIDVSRMMNKAVEDSVIGEKWSMLTV